MWHVNIIPDWSWKKKWRPTSFNHCTKVVGVNNCSTTISDSLSTTTPTTVTSNNGFFYLGFVATTRWVSNPHPFPLMISMRFWYFDNLIRWKLEKVNGFLFLQRNRRCTAFTIVNDCAIKNIARISNTLHVLNRIILNSATMDYQSP